MTSPRTSRTTGLCTTALLAAASLALATSAHAAGDAAAGKALFDKTCANCHSVEVGTNKVGPTLFDIVDRPVAAVQGFDYSKQMRAAKVRWQRWDEKHLDAYLKDPRGVLKGVRMFYAVPDPKDRADVIAHLMTLK